MDNKDITLKGILKTAPVVPVLVVHDLETAVPLAQALVAGGLRVIEVTLRTPIALQAIAAISDALENAIVGAGTVMDGEQFRAVEAAGARFAVSPGSTPALLQAAHAATVPLLPGVANVSQAMALAERGYRYLKFFPAELSGGAAYLRALSSVLPKMRFCPTGGIGSTNAADYLRLDNVVCVGGSWVCPQEHIAARNWEAITNLAREAASWQS